MPRSPATGPSPLGLVVLWLLHDESLHVYRMQKLIEAYGKDRVVNVRSRASLYQAIERLRRDGLVTVVDTVRATGRPDRTVYAITDAGRTAAQEWLRTLLRTTGGDFPDFVTAVSMLFALAPDDARAQLEQRSTAIRHQLADTEAELARSADVPRLFLLEEDYRRAVLAAELAWLDQVVDDLRHGRLSWDRPWLAAMAAQARPADEDGDDTADDDAQGPGASTASRARPAERTRAPQRAGPAKPAKATRSTKPASTARPTKATRPASTAKPAKATRPARPARPAGRMEDE